MKKLASLLTINRVELVDGRGEFKYLRPVEHSRFVNDFEVNMSRLLL